MNSTFNVGDRVRRTINWCGWAYRTDNRPNTGDEGTIVKVYDQHDFRVDWDRVLRDHPYAGDPSCAEKIVPKPKRNTL